MTIVLFFIHLTRFAICFLNVSEQNSQKLRDSLLKKLCKFWESQIRRWAMQ